MTVLQLVMSAHALDCTGLDAGTCDAVNRIQAAVNAESGSQVIHDSAVARLRPATIYAQLDVVRQEALANGCTFDTGTDGWAGGVYHHGQRRWSGVLGDFAATEWDGAGTTQPSNGLGRFFGAFTGPSTRAMGEAVSHFGAFGEVAADLDGGSGYVAGRWIRTTGGRGVWVGLSGTCGASVGAAFDEWHSSDLPSWQVYLNELQLDPGAQNLPWYSLGVSDAGDSNCDGFRSATQDEFVEVANRGDADADLSGFTISDLAGVTHTFPSGTVVGPGGTVTVFSGGAIGVSCNFDPAGQVMFSTNPLSLNNTNETVTLAGPSGFVHDQVSWTTIGAANDDSSLNRFGDPDAAFGFTFAAQSVPATPTWLNGFICFDNDNDTFTVCDGDCNDADASIFPGTVDIPENGVDEDCDAFDAPISSVVFLNEIAFSPAAVNAAWFVGLNGGDHQCDGTRSATGDEFVEVMNAGPGSKDISDWELRDITGSSARHVFPAGTVLAEGQTVTVFAAGTLPADPALCLFDATALVQLSSTGSLSLNDSNETYRLVNPLGGVMDRVEWASPGAGRSLNRLGDPTATPASTEGDPDLLGVTPTWSGFPIGG